MHWLHGSQTDLKRMSFLTLFSTLCIINIMYLNVTWTKLHRDVFELAKQVEKSSFKPEVLVAIARGGLTISHILSDFLNCPITTFTIASYAEFEQKKKPELLYSVGHEIVGKQIVLVDDVADTGATFTAGVDYLKHQGADKVMTAAPYIKPWSTFNPDFSIEKTDKWIVFPYDVRESLEALIKKWHSEGVPKSEYKYRLTDKFGFEKVFVDHYLR